MKKNNVQKQIDLLTEHAGVANAEMGHIKEEISGIRVDVSWIKESLKNTQEALDRFDSRTWVLLGTIIAGTLISIAVQLFMKH